PERVPALFDLFRLVGLAEIGRRALGARVHIAHGPRLPQRRPRRVAARYAGGAMGNSFGTLFRVSTWGESHGGQIGAVVDGCPPRLELSESDIQPDLDRRAPGQSALVTQRKESDAVRIVSGVFEGKTLGTPIAMTIANEDQRSGDYREMMEKYR